MYIPICQKVDLVYITKMTTIQVSTIAFHVDFVKAVTEDLQKKKRIEQSSCKVCYEAYGMRRQHGNRSTHYLCSLCSRELLSGTTDTDVLCLECAKREKLCKHCGADVELKFRRKRKQPSKLEVIT